ncbi:hypothetical protein MKX01_003050, partial [Papaver californicum]
MGIRVDVNKITSFLFFVFFVSTLRFSWQVNSQVFGDPQETNVSEILPLVTQLMYERLSNLTVIFQGEATENLGFCIKDQKADWNGAFNFKSDLDFLSSCIEKTKDITQHICSEVEIKLHFSRFLGLPSKPNRNCNLTSWNPGCEPGWACGFGLDSNNDNVDLRDPNEMSSRTSDCHACCAGFFFPRGLTCMIPCPLGSYCPPVELNATTGMSDSWADIRSSGEVFCPAGSYCPSTTKKLPWSDGHYCRTGSTSEKS